MSELRANTISDAAGTGPVALTDQWAAKMVIEYDTVTTTVINESNNVSSITDSGTGNSLIEMTNSMSSGNYAVVTAGDIDIGTKFDFIGPSFKAPRDLRIEIANSSGTAADTNMCGVVVFGDLA